MPTGGVSPSAFNRTENVPRPPKISPSLGEGVAGDKVGERWMKGGEGRRRDKGNVIQHTSYGETEKPGKKCDRVGLEPRTSGTKVRHSAYFANTKRMLRSLSATY